MKPISARTLLVGLALMAVVIAPGRLLATYVNPIIGQESADPYVIYTNGFYYFLRTTGGGVTIWKSATLQGVGSGSAVTVFSTNPNGPIKSDIWAPELHYLDGKWYVYACGNTMGSLSLGIQQMFVLESDTQDPQGSYTYKGILGPGTPAIDASVLVRDSDGAKFVIYSRFESVNSENVQSIYLAPLINPWTLGATPVRLSSPTYPWERVVGLVNEGPIALKRNGKTFIVYSASYTSTPDYCLGMLVNTDGNYTNAASWTKLSNPVFRRRDANNVYGPGHNGFTKSPGGTEDWIVYHATSDPTGDQRGKRSVRIQKFLWNSDDTPNFDVPLPASVVLAAPEETPGAPVHGLAGEHYNNGSLSGTPIAITTNATMDFDWSIGAPQFGVDTNGFSIRWTGQLLAPTSGTYTFQTESDDGVRLWVNGQPLINDWNAHPTTTNSAAITLAGGEFADLRLEYFDNIGSAVARLKWVPPGGVLAVVPDANLFPATNGLRGEYFNGTNFGTRVVTRLDPQVNFDWGTSLPDVGVPADAFSVRWTGRLRAPVDGSYTLHTVSDDGIRLWLGGQLLISNWTQHVTMEDIAVFTMAAGQEYDLRLEAYDAGGNAVAKLLWTPPGGPKTSIPAAQFLPPGGAPVGSGTGLRGDYFNNLGLMNPVLTRTDAQIDFDWGAGSPDAVVSSDTFSIRWTGQIQPRYSGPYTFYVNSDNGRRLWVNNQLLIDGWVDDWGVEYSGSISLIAGQKYDLRLEHFENAGAANCHLEWMSDQQMREAVPQAQLYLSTNTLPGRFWVVDASGNWSATNNWNGGVVADGPGENGVFSLDLTADRFVTNDLPRTIGGLTFGDADPNSPGSWALGGIAPLTIQSSNGAPVISVGALGAAKSVTIACPLAGSNGLIKNGAGTLVLNASNTYIGTTTINEGAVRIAGGNNRLSAGTSVVLADVAGTALDIYGLSQTIATLSGGGTNGGNILLGGGVITVGDTNTTTYGGAVLGAGGQWVKQGSGMLTMAGVVTVSNTFINSGTLKLGAGYTSLGGGVSGIAAGATLDLNSQTVSGSLQVDGVSATPSVMQAGNFSGKLNGSSTAWLAFNGSTTLSGNLTNYPGSFSLLASAWLNLNTNVTLSSLSFANSGSPLLNLGHACILTVANVSMPITADTLSGPADAGNTATLVLNCTNSSTSLGVIQGRLDVSKRGPGVFTVGQTYAQTFQSLTVQQGTWKATRGAGGVGPNNKLGVGPVTVQSGATLQVDTLENTTHTNQLYLDGMGVSGGGALRYTMATAYNNTPTWSGPITLTGPARIQNATGSGINATQVRLNGNIAGNFTLTLGVDNANNSVVVNGSLGFGPGSLIKDGSGPVYLSGANTYSGDTLVTVGKLALLNSASLSNSPLISLSAAATFDVTGFTNGVFTILPSQTLSGLGIVSGNLLVRGTLAPGTNGAPGALTVSSNLTLTGSTLIKLSKSANTNDVVRGMSSVVFGGTLMLTNLAGVLANGDVFRIFTAASYSGSFTDIVPPAPGLGLRWNAAALTNDGTLRIETAPATNPPSITWAASGGQLTLNWDHAGWHLQGQTNSAGIGLSSNWFTFPGSTNLNQMAIPIDPACPAAFYRLVYP